MTGVVQRLGTRLHASVLAASHGRIGGRFGKAPMLVLETTGARSGKRRRAPLLYQLDGDGYVLIASNGGAAAHPGWYHNLRADPDVEILVDGRTIPVHAEVAAGAERARLWQLLVSVYPGYDGYQAKTAREIPVVRLAPRSGAGSGAG